MAVVSCRRTNVDASFGLENKNSYTMTYRIVTSGVNEPPPSVLSGALAASPDPLPRMYSVYAYDIGAYVIGINLARESEVDARNRWIATVQFGQLPEGKDPSDGDPEISFNPLLRKTRWGGDFDRVTRTTTVDRFGKPILNSAGQLFDEPIIVPRSLPVIVARKNYATLDEIMTIGRTYDQTVNSKTYLKHPPRTVLFDSVTPSEQQWERGISYHEATFRFVIKSETWDDKYLNRGYKYIDDNGDLVAAKDDEGMLVSEPVLLTADGKKLPQGAVGTFTDRKQLLYERDFADLDLE